MSINISGWHSNFLMAYSPNIYAMLCPRTIQASCGWENLDLSSLQCGQETFFSISDILTENNMATHVKYCRVCWFQSVGARIGRCLDNGGIWEQASTLTPIVGKQYFRENNSWIFIWLYAINIPYYLYVYYSYYIYIYVIYIVIHVILGGSSYIIKLILFHDGAHCRPWMRVQCGGWERWVDVPCCLYTYL